MLTALSIVAALAGAPADPVVVDRGRAWELRAHRRDGGGLCLRYAGRGSTTSRPGKRQTFRERLCGSTGSETVRFEASLVGCTTAPGALFGFAGPDVVKVNVRVGDGRVQRLKLRRLPASVGVAGSTFVFRRSLDGAHGTITGHFADGQHLTRRFGPYPIPGCAGPPVEPDPGG